MDEDEPQSKAAAAVRNIEPLSVAELNAYILELETEIARVRLAIKAKQNVRAGADQLFRK